MILVVAKDEDHLGDPGHSCCCDDAHLCYVRTQSVRCPAALAYEQLARLQNDAGSLLVIRLGPIHRRSRDRLSDCFRACLVALDVRPSHSQPASFAPPS